MEYVRIPLGRVGVLVGTEGRVKKRIEEELGVKLTIDSDEGTVAIENVSEDVLAGWKARDIITAIGRGINPYTALKLKSDEYTMEIIELVDLVGKSQKALARQKGRIIGTQGKTRKFIEEATGVSLSVFGKSVVILGSIDEVWAAKEAVVKLATGMPHGVVYKILQKKARELKKKRMSLWR